MNLETLGWNEFFSDNFNKYYSNNINKGRVIAQYKNKYKVFTEKGEKLVNISGKFHNSVKEAGNYPAVGDWVALSGCLDDNSINIEGILPRFSTLSRKTIGKITGEQLIAVNIDIVFIVVSLDNNFNLRRIERYLTAVNNSRAKPVILLNKADICNELYDKIEQAKKAFENIPVHSLNSINGKGYDELTEYVEKGKTIVLLGSSGVGKSTIINNLMGNGSIKTREVRESDSKGKHTTTKREMYILPGEALIIDNPGIREFQLWAEESSLNNTFEDIIDLSLNCKFRNCKHESEPECAVRSALEKGIISLSHFENYKKMQREIRYLEVNKDEKSQYLEKQRVRKLWRGRSKITKYNKKNYN